MNHHFPRNKALKISPLFSGDNSLLRRDPPFFSFSPCFNMDLLHLRHAVLSIGEVKRSIGDWQVQIGAKRGH